MATLINDFVNTCQHLCRQSSGALGLGAGSNSLRSCRESEKLTNNANNYAHVSPATRQRRYSLKWANILLMHYFHSIVIGLCHTETPQTSTAHTNTHVMRIICAQFDEHKWALIARVPFLICCIHGYDSGPIRPIIMYVRSVRPIEFGYEFFFCWFGLFACILFVYKLTSIARYLITLMALNGAGVILLFHAIYHFIVNLSFVPHTTRCHATFNHSTFAFAFKYRNNSNNQRNRIMNFILFFVCILLPNLYGKYEYALR